MPTAETNPESNDPIRDSNTSGIQWVYPPEGHRTFERSVLLVGQVLVNATVTLRLNEGVCLPLKLSANGYFGAATPPQLQPGINTLCLTLTDTQGKLLTTISRMVVCQADESFNTLLPPPPIKGEAPLFQFAPETLSPTGSLTVMAGDSFGLQCWLKLAPENFCGGLSVSFQVENLLHTAVDFHHDYSYWETRQPVFAELHHVRPPVPMRGWIDTVIEIPPDCPPLEEAACLLHVEQRLVTDHEEQLPVRHTLMLPLKLTVWPKPGWGKVGCENNALGIVARTAPKTGARLTPLMGETGGHVTRIENGWVCLQLGEDGFKAWVAEDTVTVFEPGELGFFASERQPAHLPLMRLISSPENRQPELWISLLGCNSPPPVQVELKPDGLRLTLYNTVSYCDFVREDLSPSSGVAVTHRQVAPTTVEIYVSCPRLLGYAFEFFPADPPLGDELDESADSFPSFEACKNESGLLLRLRQLPLTVAETRILLDPGHGGEELGAIAPNGTPEKTLNLRLTEQVAEALRAVGFNRITLTRSNDIEVSLDERVRQAQQTDADITLSLHHNALPDGRDPDKHQGPVVLYYQPTARALAWHLQTELLPLWNLPFDAMDTVYQDSLAITRISTGLGLLIEAGYLTHPDDAERLLNPTFMQQWVTTLAQALVSYCRERF